MTLKDGLPVTFSSNFNGLLESFDSKFVDDNISMLLITLKELTLIEDSKISYREGARLNEPCGFCNTVVLTSFQTNRSAAESELIDAIESGECNPGCVPVGEQDTSCMWGNHGCVSTQTYCCP